MPKKIHWKEALQAEETKAKDAQADSETSPEASPALLIIARQAAKQAQSIASQKQEHADQIKKSSDYKESVRAIERCKSALQEAQEAQSLAQKKQADNAVREQELLARKVETEAALTQASQQLAAKEAAIAQQRLSLKAAAEEVKALGQELGDAKRLFNEKEKAQAALNVIKDSQALLRRPAEDISTPVLGLQMSISQHYDTLAMYNNVAKENELFLSHNPHITAEHIASLQQQFDALSKRPSEITRELALSEREYGGLDLDKTEKERTKEAAAKEHTAALVALKAAEEKNNQAREKIEHLQGQLHALEQRPGDIEASALADAVFAQGIVNNINVHVAAIEAKIVTPEAPAATTPAPLVKTSAKEKKATPEKPKATAAPSINPLGIVRTWVKDNAVRLATAVISIWMPGTFNGEPNEHLAARVVSAATVQLLPPSIRGSRVAIGAAVGAATFTGQYLTGMSRLQSARREIDAAEKTCAKSTSQANALLSTYEDDAIKPHEIDGALYAKLEKELVAMAESHCPLEARTKETLRQLHLPPEMQNRTLSPNCSVETIKNVAEQLRKKYQGNKTMLDTLDKIVQSQLTVKQQIRANDDCTNAKALVRKHGQATWVGTFTSAALEGAITAGIMVAGPFVNRAVQSATKGGARRRTR